MVPPFDATKRPRRNGADTTMRRYGFGEKTGETEFGGLAQYEHGVVEFSEKASKHATQKYPKESPAGAVALELAAVGGVDLADYADADGPTVDFEALHEAVGAIDGVGEETADAVIETLQATL